MDNTSQELLNLYNDLDALLQKRYHDNDRNRSMIMRYSLELQRSPYSKAIERGRLLNSIRIIRNILIHDLDMNRDSLIQISPKLLDTLKYEIKLLEDPKTAIDISTHIDKLLKASMTDKIVDVFVKMAEKGYMQLPVLNKNGSLFGVISPNALLYFMSEATDLRPDCTIQDMSKYLTIDMHICEHYAFVGKDDDVEAVSSIFDDYYKKGKKLAMVFVTEHGKENETILGIITAYDIVHLEHE